ncbi:T9SS type A sorting domain-containing protein [Epilithonimonas hungarica]|uniref:Por secretion system C-terminal sorting domain-containing protein n=1 Tax=Epilithonimonas hungarica TaxID=454006 RepID=A0A1G7MUH3_9FLAO|nr:T9SS type A sorting domain-containing protein [Epilithonimonas hungarica]SDF65347.1 Por secretion system C-terminal sorting domain-containing protein [Epilithonimonas hungarica]
MKINLLIIISIFPFFKSQTCYYTEVNPISHGYSCNESNLIFTSSINTVVRNDVSASNGILIIPSQNYNITILPSIPCDNCAADTGGTTIIPKKNGNDGANKRIYYNSQKTVKSQEITIEENPVEHILKLSLDKGILENIKIYDANGQEVLNNDTNNKTSEINVSRLIKGTYWLKVMTNENTTYTKQFIKK